MVSACDQQELKITEVEIPVGEDSVMLVITTSDRPGLRYVVLHDDENSAAEAATEIVREHGGSLYELRHEGERNVTFHLEGRRHAFDPNRMFSAEGVASSLARWTPGEVAPGAAEQVKGVADTVLHYLTANYDDLLVAVHNNKADGYSILSYTNGELTDDARFSHLASGEDADDFFFTTSERVYHLARDAGFHAVLQNQILAVDDGSLSVYAAANDLPYANVEAEHGHLAQQIKMLEFLAEAYTP